MNEKEKFKMLYQCNGNCDGKGCTLDTNKCVYYQKFRDISEQKGN